MPSSNDRPEGFPIANWVQGMDDKCASLPDGMFELSSPRLLLRPARAEDALALNVAFSDPEVMRYWSVTAGPTTRAPRADSIQE